tara:strand:+ start:43974 stop:45104 length:1131 start_codon:yes stop_codon:yes gene_type:complete
VVAAEPSGDRLGGGVVSALRARLPAVELRGVGGPELTAHGLQSICDIHDLSIMGVEDLVRKLPHALGIRRRLYREFVSDPPDLFLGIDSPDFNLSLERRLRASGVPIIHLVSPTVWAWRSYRVAKIRRAVDRILVLFPFEERFYEARGVPATFVGHPAARETSELTKTSARADLGISTETKVVSVLPGSRESEIRHLAKVFAGTMRALALSNAEVQFLVPFASERVRQQFRQLTSLEGFADRVTLVDGRARSCLAASDAALLASGTAALEAALVGCPMVVAYRVSGLSYRIATALASTRMVSMPNHLMPTPLIPEFLQDDANEQNLVAAVQQLLDDEAATQEMRKALGAIQSDLNIDTNNRIVDAMLEMAPPQSAG